MSRGGQEPPHPGSPAGPWGWKVVSQVLLCFTTELHTQMEKSQMEKSSGQTLASFDCAESPNQSFPGGCFHGDSGEEAQAGAGKSRAAVTTRNLIQQEH